MTLRLGRAFLGGLQRIGTRTGAVLLAALLGIQLLVQVSVNSAVVAAVPPDAAAELRAMTGLFVSVPPTVAAAALVGSLAVNGVFFVVLARAFARPVAALSTIPRDLLTRRIGRATVSLVVGGLLALIGVLVGVVFVVVPGLLLAASFLFFPFAVGVEDEGAAGGL